MPRTRKRKQRVRYEALIDLPPLSPEEYQGLYQSIAVNGVLLPILVDCDGPKRRIVDGNYRKAISDDLGYDCPEIVCGGDEEELRALARAACCKIAGGDGGGQEAPGPGV